MKTIMTLFISLFFLTCQSEKKSEAEALNEDLPNTDLYEPLESEQSSDDENYQVALDFLNGYIENNNELEILEYVKTSALATENLKTALELIIIKAWEDDPEVGLGFDPLFDAQDYPSKGVELFEFDSKTGYVMVKGIEWDEFRVAMRVVKENGHLLVDGCGVVNIPEDKQAER